MYTSSYNKIYSKICYVYLKVEKKYLYSHKNTTSKCFLVNQSNNVSITPTSPLRLLVHPECIAWIHQKLFIPTYRNGFRSEIMVVRTRIKKIPLRHWFAVIDRLGNIMVISLAINNCLTTNRKRHWFAIYLLETVTSMREVWRNGIVCIRFRPSQFTGASFSFWTYF